MNDLAPEWQKLRGDKTEEGKTKMKALEQKIDAVEAEQNAEIAAFCKETRTMCCLPTSCRTASMVSSLPS